jgi:hypothetical protein
MKVAFVDEGVTRALPTHDRRFFPLEVLGAFEGSYAMVSRPYQTNVSTQPRGEFSIEVDAITYLSSAG